MRNSLLVLGAAVAAVVAPFKVVVMVAILSALGLLLLRWKPRRSLELYELQGRTFHDTMIMYFTGCPVEPKRYRRTPLVAPPRAGDLLRFEGVWVMATGSNQSADDFLVLPPPIQEVFTCAFSESS